MKMDEVALKRLAATTGFRGEILEKWGKSRMMKNFFPSPLQYVWPMQEAEKSREIILRSMEAVGFGRRMTNKKITIDLTLPKAATQAGAVQFGGQEAKIGEKNAIAYMVLRFYKLLIPQAVYDRLSKLELRQDETDKSGEVRFFFTRDDFDLGRAEKTLVKIQQAWKQ